MKGVNDSFLAGTTSRRDRSGDQAMDRAPVASCGSGSEACGAQAWNGLGGRWRQFQAAEHKVKQLLPGVKHPVARQRPEIIEERAARGQGLAE